MENFEITVGHKIRFVDEKPTYEVKCFDGRFAVCVRNFHKKHDANLLKHEVKMGAFLTLEEAYNAVKDDVVYSIIDLQNSIRAPHFFIFNPYDFKTQGGCDACLSDLQSGACELSRRNKIDLQIEAVI